MNRKQSKDWKYGGVIRKPSKKKRRRLEQRRSRRANRGKYNGQGLH